MKLDNVKLSIQNNGIAIGIKKVDNQESMETHRRWSSMIVMKFKAFFYPYVLTANSYDSSQNRDSK